MKNILKNIVEKKVAIQGVKLQTVPLCSYLAILCLLFILSTKVSAQQSPSELIVGTWFFDDVPSYNSMHPDTKSRLDTIPQTMAKVTALYTGRKLHFFDDGTFTISLADGRSVSSTWSLTNDGMLALSSVSGDDTTYEQIMTLTSTKLVLTPKIVGDIRNVIQEQHYTKQ